MALFAKQPYRKKYYHPRYMPQGNTNSSVFSAWTLYAICMPSAVWNRHGIQKKLCSDSEYLHFPCLEIWQYVGTLFHLHMFVSTMKRASSCKLKIAVMFSWLWLHDLCKTLLIHSYILTPSIDTEFVPRMEPSPLGQWYHSPAAFELLLIKVSCSGGSWLIWEKS